jgi:hypothetical protein
MRKKPEQYEWWLILFALAYGVVMLSVNGGFQLWSLSPYHLYQAKALLDGHFYLANSIEAIQPGLAWHDGHVQHVWGLGIGLWLLPFQALWHLFGGNMFPDRIALGVAFALLAFYAGRTGLNIINQGHRLAGLGIIWLILLCPPLWTLTRASQSVFEQTVLYAVLVSLGIIVSVVRVAWFGSRTDYLLCCVLSSFAVWVRPTHAIYGLSAMLICSLIMLGRQRAVKLVVLGSFGFLAGLALLGMTNWMRFGSPAEFGHRLTVSSDSMIYLTRFGNPFSTASPVDATRELAGLLFLDSNVRDANAYSEDLFPGQSSETRWRRLYLTAFDPSYAVLCLAAVVGVAFWFVKHRRKMFYWQQPEHTLVVALFLWSSISVAGLGVFYLHFPVIASRYLSDFTPALIGFAVLLWMLISTRWGRFLWPFLAVWLVGEIVIAKIPIQTPRQGSQAHIEPVLPPPKSIALSQFGGSYTLSHHPADTGIAWNGHGWESGNGFADDIVVLAVDKPQFVELRIGERRASNGEPAKKDVYRAMIDGVLLPLREVERGEDGLRVMFDIPSDLRARLNNEVLFLCFSDGYKVEDRVSERLLYSVQWKPVPALSQSSSTAP